MSHPENGSGWLKMKRIALTVGSHGIGDELKMANRRRHSAREGKERLEPDKRTGGQVET